MTAEQNARRPQGRTLPPCATYYHGWHTGTWRIGRTRVKGECSRRGGQGVKQQEEAAMTEKEFLQIGKNNRRLKQLHRKNIRS